MINTFPVEIQYDKMDCGPTCLKIIAKHYGKFYSLHFLREKCGVTREGISLKDLSYAAESIGMRSRTIRCTINDLFGKVPFPCIIHWNDNHFVVLYKVTKQKIFLSDPYRGLISFNHQEFTEYWLKEPNSTKDSALEQPKGVVMVLEPMSDFKDRHLDEEKNRKKTFSALVRYFLPYKKDFVQCWGERLDLSNVLIDRLTSLPLQSKISF